MSLRRKIFSALFWVATVLLCVFIFFFSAKEAEESAAESGAVLQWLESVFGAGLTDFIVRKAAHILEYAALGFFAGGAFLSTFRNNTVLFQILSCTAYACSDEIHQYFVPGRACQLRDVFIDASGIIIGVCIVNLICYIVKKEISRKVS